MNLHVITKIVTFDVETLLLKKTYYLNDDKVIQYFESNCGFYYCRIVRKPFKV